MPHMGGFWCRVTFVPERTDVDLVAASGFCVPDAMVLAVE